MEESRVKEELDHLIGLTKGLDVRDMLIEITKIFPREIVFTSSFSKEDQWITHLIATDNLDINIVTLDTGRNFNETLKVFEETQKKYQLKIQAFYPNTENVETYVNTHGINGFYEDIDLRKKCCYIRKVEPLHRALKGHKIWVTGIRASHNAHRENMPKIEFDAANSIIKVHPILDLTDKELDQNIWDNDVPTNKLYSMGYKSIGCAPCTRPVSENQHPRAGRWWWEQDVKECGLHFTDNQTDTNKK